MPLRISSRRRRLTTISGNGCVGSSKEEADVGPWRCLLEPDRRWPAPADDCIDRVLRGDHCRSPHSVDRRSRAARRDVVLGAPGSRVDSAEPRSATPRDQVVRGRAAGASTAPARSVPGTAGLRSLVRRRGLVARVERVSDDRAFALTYGLWRPRIVISDGLIARCSDDELAAVLEHEAEHVRVRDPLRIFLCRIAVLRSLLMPVLAHLAQRARCDAELAADRRAAPRIGPAVLARALLIASAPPVPLAADVISGFGDRDMLEARVLQLEGARVARRRPARRAIAISAGDCCS
ncbi:hypothetical protein DI005_33180 [Prauserella sp. PE36]|nr:hypothetical protein DI005_33180 [Prauserella sp. PE36]